MSFWRPIGAVLGVRLIVARNAFKRNPTAQLASLFFTAIFALSALSIGSALAREWSISTPSQAVNSLEAVLVIVMIVLALAYAAPGSVSLMGPMPPDSVLCPFPLTRLQRVVAELLTCLLDLPTVLAFLVAVPFMSHVLTYNRPAPVVATLIAGSLIAILAGLLMRAIWRIAALFVRRSRKLVDVSAMTSLLFVGCSVALPPAFAALSAPTVIGSNHPKLSTDANVSALRMVSPPHLAADAVSAAAIGNTPHVVANILSLALETAALFTFALATAGNAQQKSTTPIILRRSRRQHGESNQEAKSFSNRTGVWIQLEALVTTEVKLLLRQPQNFLSLHKPASMILVGFFALLAPDMGKNPVYSAKELLSIATVLYPAMWQIQLLCNRFGADAGKASIIFGFSIDRRLLVLGKNVALLLVLLVLDSGALAGLDYAIGEPGVVRPMLTRLPVILLIATSFGNLVSVLQPFAIPRFAGDSAEPPNYLIAVYTLLIVATTVITFELMPVSGDPSISVLPGVILIVSLFVGSVLVTAKRLARTERSLIAVLDGGA